MLGVLWPGDWLNLHHYRSPGVNSESLYALNFFFYQIHYIDVIMSATASEITSLMIAYSTFYSGADERKHQSSASLAFVRGIHRWPVNSTHKGPVTWKIFPFDDVIMYMENLYCIHLNSSIVKWYFAHAMTVELSCHLPYSTVPYMPGVW